MRCAVGWFGGGGDGGSGGRVCVRPRAHAREFANAPAADPRCRLRAVQRATVDARGGAITVIVHVTHATPAGARRGLCRVTPTPIQATRNPVSIGITLASNAAPARAGYHLVRVLGARLQAVSDAIIVAVHVADTAAAVRVVGWGGRGVTFINNTTNQLTMPPPPHHCCTHHTPSAVLPLSLGQSSLQLAAPSPSLSVSAWEQPL